MARHAFGFLAVPWLIAGAAALADPPKIDDIRPSGLKRGEPTDVTISGANLGANPQFLAPFPVTTEKAPNADGGNFRVKLAVPATVPLGVYVVRVRTDEGISNPFLFAVGQVPWVAEVEDNSVFEAAQAVAAPAVVEGRCAGSDVDYFRFAGKKGQRVVVDARCARIGSGVDPQVRLTTAGRKFVESADDTPGLMTDARLSAVLPEDGDYVVELSDSKYQGGGRPAYHLLIGAVPVAAEIYPLGGRRGETVGFELRGGTLAETRVAAGTIDTPRPTDLFRLKAAAGDLDIEIPTALDVGEIAELRESNDPQSPPTRGVAPVVFNGRIDPAGDEDRFTVAVTPGQALRIRVDASELGSALDGTLQILGPAGNVLAAAEDTVIPASAAKGAKKPPGLVSPDPSLDFAVPAGVNEITLALRDLIGRGGVGFPYRISVEPITPAFHVQLVDSQVSIPRGGTVAIGVTVARQGFNGPVALSIANPPAGLTFRPLTIPAGQPAGTFTATASADASFGPLDLKVVGTGQGPAGPIVDEGAKLIVFAQQGNVPTNTVTQAGLPATSALPLPAAIDAPATPVEIVHGYGGQILLKVTRAAGADAAMAIASLPLPPNMAASGTIADKAADGAATLTAPAEAPLGPAPVILTAKGKFGDKEVTLVAPLVIIDVVRPAALEIGTPAVEVKAGGSVEVRGKVVRKGPFKEPVKLTLGGLPAGLKAAPVDLGPEATDFTLKIEADAIAPAAQADAPLALAFQINKKDYPFPAGKVAVKVVGP